MPDVTAPLPGLRITAADLDPAKHELFDTTGGTHAISEVVVLKRWVKSVRTDGWVDYFAPTDTLNIHPKENTP